jgi:PAS domain S-box-containing protein
MYHIAFYLNKMDVKSNIYNSRIIRVYLEFIEKKYPHLDRDDLLKYAKISKYEVHDKGYWLSQDQVDRFHEILVEKSGNPDISRESGRYMAMSQDISALKQHILGFINLTFAYYFLGKFYGVLSRGAIVKAKKLRSNKVQVDSVPTSAANEKPYQCEYRMGTLESIALLFIGKLATIKHPICFHKGGDCCRYIITWETKPHATWKTVRNYSLLFFILAIPALFFLLPVFHWAAFSLSCVFIAMTLSFYTAYLEKKELIKTIESQGDTARELLLEMNVRYDNALFNQKISQAAATILDVYELVDTVTGIMEKHLDFDRGIVMLANRKKTRLTYSAGYGYSEEDKQALKQIEFHLDNPDASGVFVKSHKELKTILVDNINDSEKGLSIRSRKLVNKMDVESLICVPIIYEKESLGILAVDNISSKRLLTQSDINLLSGLASQLALGIANAMSFKKLQESEEKFREMAEMLPEVVYEYDAQRNLTFLNKAAFEKYDLTQEDLDKGVNAQQLIAPDDRKRAKEDISKILSGIERGPFEYIAQRMDGSRFPIISYLAPIIRDGEPVGLRGITLDITDRKRREDEKAKMEEQLRRSQKLETIGTLTGGIAHDFNNILTPILGYADMALSGLTSSNPLYEDLEHILKGAKRAKDLVEQILLFSKQVEKERKPLALHLIVKEAVKLLRPSIPTSIEIRQRIDASCDKVLVDATQIHQVIVNLCTNAWQAIEEKGGLITIELKQVKMDAATAKLHPNLNEAEYVRLTVIDTGTGMDKATLERIFEPFFTTKAVDKGTGMGLSVVHGIVRSHHGDVFVHSEPGKGSTFQVYLPVVEAKAETAKIEPKAIVGGQESILVVDDDEEITNMIRQMLEQLGYKVDVYNKSPEALKVIRQQPDKYDLLISDLTMPKMTGLDLSERLQKFYSGLPVIIMTGYGDRLTSTTVKHYGIKQVVRKPILRRELAPAIREVLDN